MTAQAKTTVLQGPDGVIYEIPNEVLARYAVPGEKFEELRTRMAAPAPPAGSAPPAIPIPAPPPGGSVVLNFYFQSAPPALHVNGPAPDASVQPYHLAFDEHGIPVKHIEMRWGDYVDRQGRPMTGYHSHDPVTGNAQ